MRGAVAGPLVATDFFTRVKRATGTIQESVALTTHHPTIERMVPLPTTVKGGMLPLLALQAQPHQLHTCTVLTPFMLFFCDCF